MAGLIPNTFIDDLLARADIVDVVGNRITLKKTGKNYSGLCPFHQEKSPSFTVEPSKQFYYCFGCGAGGNALGFIMNYENLEFPQAVEALARNMGVEVPYEESPDQHRQREKRQTLYDVLTTAARFYQQQLRQHDEREKAVNYLKGRGLSGATARDFGLGFAPPGWDNLLKSQATDEEQRKMLIDAGMVIEKENPKNPFHDRFRDRIMFPIRDSRGRIIGFGGRVLGDDKPKYLNSPETPIFRKGEELYGLYEARQKVRNLKRVLIVEGYMDVISLAQHGVHYTVATLGTATSASHLQRLFKLVPEIVFCFDGDSAGRQAAWRALEHTLPQMKDGLTARFLFLPDGEDPDTWIRKVGSQSFEKAVMESTSMAEFFFEELGEQVNMQSLEGRARLGSLALPLINTIPAGIYRQLMMDQLSALTGADAATLNRGNVDNPASDPARFPAPIGALSAPSAPSAPSSTSNRPPGPGRSNRRDTDLSACLKAVNLLLLNPELAHSVNHDGLEEAHAPDIALLKQVITLARKHPGNDTHQLLGRLYATAEGTRLIKLASREQITPPEGRDEEYASIIRKLIDGQRRKQELNAKLEEARQNLSSRTDPQ